MRAAGGRGDEAYDPSTLSIPRAQWAHFSPDASRRCGTRCSSSSAFYELYERDALLGHHQFDLKRTDRVNMCMAGVPQSSFEEWASKFIGLGYKVARVDEMETTLAKAVRERETSARKEKIVRRELTGILTRGTLHGDFRTTDSSNYVLCLREAAEAGGGARLGRVPLRRRYGRVSAEATTRASRGWRRC